MPPDRVAFVTGASRGLGLAVCRALEGHYRLGLGFRNNAPPMLEDAIPIQADLSSSTQADASVAKVIGAYGRLDLLVCSAAVTKDVVFLRMSDQDWDEVIGANLTGTFRVLRAAAPFLKESRGAAILVSSIIGRRGGAGSVNYAASKAALFGLAGALAVELAPEIRVNVVVPGYMETDMGRGNPGLLERAVREHPLGIPTPVADAARLIVSVAGLESVTGQIFTADGRKTRWY